MEGAAVEEVGEVEAVVAVEVDKVEEAGVAAHALSPEA